MRIRRSIGSPLSLVVSGLVTFGFVGCFSDVRSLNSASEAGFGGEEGESPFAGADAGATAGSAGTVYAAGKGGGAGKGGRAGGSTGGTSTAGSSTGGADGGSLAVGGSGGSAGGPGSGGSNSTGGMGTGGGAGGPSGGAGSGGSAGSVPWGGAGSGGSAGSAGSAPWAGSAGTGFAGNTGAGTACDSTDGSGCGDTGTFCVDTIDACNPDSQASDTCPGVCGLPYESWPCAGNGGADVPCAPGFECLPDVDSYFGTIPLSRCVGPGLPVCDSASDCPGGYLCLDSGDDKRCLPGLVDCSAAPLCDGASEVCAASFRHAVIDDCAGPCIPADRCGCEQDSDCEGTGTCDRSSGRCRLEQWSAHRCLVPYLEAPCDPSGVMFSFVDGLCQEVSCPASENRFPSLAECLSACAGMPVNQGCNELRAERLACVQCNPAGGCSRKDTVCLLNCENDDGCSDPGTHCVGGVCEMSCPP